MITMVKAAGITLLAYFLVFGSAVAQNQLAVPLTHPGEPGILEVELVNGSIYIESHQGDEVIVKIDGDGRKVTQQPTSGGMRKITGPSVGLEITEENNRVEVDTEMPGNRITLNILVPRNFSIEASTVNQGDIGVKNIDGELELSNVNGSITAESIRGAVVANTVNGDIRVQLKSVNENTPMAYSSLNGDIRVSMPENVAITVMMKSFQGDIYTDFDMDLDVTEKTSERNRRGVYKVELNRSMRGKINGGGPEVSFKTHNGDIYIQKR